MFLLIRKTIQQPRPPICSPHSWLVVMAVVVVVVVAVVAASALRFSTYRLCTCLLNPIFSREFIASEINDL
ncbi:hypothetical protein E2C01_031702 [Portunus trituberculatus]|uniref:Uncharacterized protein n=1 Tax=Portunus trituberculatus TaxID=210409 RepID=A0A5B7EYV3_PORTR|nr:hypothetical protein [Portunus trituberculatus]